MSLKLLLAVLLVNYVQSDFVCPTTAITKDSGIKGVIPNGAARNNAVPINTNCTFWFNIPQGFAVQLLIVSTYDNSQKDDLIFVDAAGDRFRVSSSTNGVTEWAPATKSGVQVVGATGKNTFYAEYAYVDISGYKQSTPILSTGSYQPLNFANNSYYTWTSQKNDAIVLTTARRNTQTTDSVIGNTYVFDGPDITTSTYLGRLSSISDANSPSSKNSITLVNFYQTVSSSYVIANDLKAISNFTKYTAILSSSNTVTYGQLSDFSYDGAAYTFICTDCDNFYVTKLKFTDSFNTGYAKFSGMSPTHLLPSPLTYYVQTFLDESLPQVIPSKMFTMQLYLARVGLNVTTDGGSWLDAYDGRQAIVFNPLAWDPTGKNSFDYTFNSDKLMNYNVSMSQLSFKGTDSLRLTIRDGSSSTVDNTYPKVTSTSGFVAGNGKQASLKYQNGVASSNIKVLINMNVVQSATFLGTLVTIILPFLFAMD